MIEPLFDYVLIRPTKAEEKVSGIAIPDSLKEKPTIGEVISVGEDVKRVKPKDRVFYKKYSSTEIKEDVIEGKTVSSYTYLLVKEEDILARKQ
jgi:chaperonin GroES